MTANEITAFVERYRDEAVLPRPLVLGVLGDFSGEPDPARPHPAQRRWLDVESHRLDRTLASVGPRVVAEVANFLDDRGPLTVDLRFERLADFEPDSLCRRVPELAALMGRRSAARHAEPGAVPAIDRALNAQLNAILHAPALQQLEASWRGLHSLLVRVPTGPQVQVRMLDASQFALWKLLRKFRGTHFDKSPTFKDLYEHEYATLGGRPCLLLIGDYAFSHDPKDIDLLKDLSLIAGSAHATVLSAASPRLFGATTFAEAGTLREPSRLFRSAEYLAWRDFCTEPEAGNVALALPRVLMRRPHDVLLQESGFRFTETIGGPEDLLWGNPAYAAGANLFAGFVAHRCFAGVPEIPMGGLISRANSWNERGVEADISEKLRGEMESVGLITLWQFRGTDRIAYSPPRALASAGWPADKSTTYLPHRLALHHTVHALKALTRAMSGSIVTDASAQSLVKQWLDLETTTSPALAARIRAPFREVALRVERRETWMPECPEAAWSVSIHCTPHAYGGDEAADSQAMSSPQLQLRNGGPSVISTRA